MRKLLIALPLITGGYLANAQTTPMLPDVEKSERASVIRGTYAAANALKQQYPNWDFSTTKTLSTNARSADKPPKYDHAGLALSATKTVADTVYQTTIKFIDKALNTVRGGIGADDGKAKLQVEQSIRVMGPDNTGRTFIGDSYTLPLHDFPKGLDLHRPADVAKLTVDTFTKTQKNLPKTVEKMRQYYRNEQQNNGAHGNKNSNKKSGNAGVRGKK